MKPTSFMIDQRRGQAKARGWSGASIAGTDTIYGSTISAIPSDGSVLVLNGTTDAWDPRLLLGLAGDVLSPAQLTANTNDWSPTGLSTCSAIRVSTDASRNLTGIVAPSLARAIVLANVGSNPLVLKHDVTSTAANRFYCPSSADYTLAANAGVLLVYDTTSSRWRVSDQANPAAVPAFATPSIAYGTPAGGAASTVIRSDATIAKPTAADVDFSADVTTNNVSTSAHGLTPKLPNNASVFLDGTGAFSSPASLTGILQSAIATRTAGDLTTTSTTFVDATGLTVTLTTGARRCLVLFDGVGFCGTAGQNFCVDLAVDGTLQGQTLGLTFVGAASNNSLGFTYLTGVLSAASHTIKIQIKVSGTGTGTLFASTGVTASRLTVLETGLTV